MNRIESRTLADQVFELLEAAILSDELRPGVELAEVDLAEKFGVSRGPVREALRKLGLVGLVSLTPRRPAVVRILSKKEILDTYRLREALEELAIRLATPLITAEQLDHLDQTMGEMERAVEGHDVDRFFRANTEFHKIFIDASDNLPLSESHDRVSRPMARYRSRSLELRGDLSSSLLEHQKIIAAVRAQDADLASRLLRDHIHVPQDRLENLSEEAWIEMSGTGSDPARARTDPKSG